MAKYALVENNKVINIVLGIPSPLSDSITVLELTGSASTLNIGNYWDFDNNAPIDNTTINLLNKSIFLDSDNETIEIDSKTIYGSGSNEFILLSNNNINSLSISNLSSKTLDISNFEFSPLSSSFNLTIKPEYADSTDNIFVDFKLNLDGVTDSNNNPVSYVNSPLYFTGSI